MTNCKSKKYLITGIVAAIFIAGLYLYNLLKPMPGADDGAGELVSKVAPGYQSWVSTLGYEPNNVTEPIIFGAQLLLGIGALWFFIHKLKQHKSHNSNDAH